MNFAQLVSILRARKWLVLAVLTVTVVATIGISLLLAKQYTASATVVVDVKADPIALGGYPQGALSTLVATQVDVMRSQRVALRVIQDLKLTENAAVRAQWQESTDGLGSIEIWLVELLQKQLVITPATGSNVISLSYTAPDPRYAAAVANAFVKAHIATTLDLRVDPAKQFATFFEGRGKDARDALEKAQNARSAFQREKGIIAADERMDIESARLAELSSQLVQLQAISAESASREVQAQGASSERIQEVLNSGLLSNLKAELGRSEARHQELSARLGENHPQRVESRANIDELRRKLDAETRQVSGGVKVSANINRSREAQVRRELDAQRGKVLQMKAVRDEGLVLQREVENAQRNYDAVMARINQMGLESQANQSNVNVLSAAQPPLQPSSPKLLLNTALAVFLGALLALGAALLLELMDRRVRTPEDIVTMLELSVIGVLPKSDAKRRVGRTRAALMQQRVLGLPAPGRTA